MSCSPRGDVWLDIEKSTSPQIQACLLVARAHAMPISVDPFVSLSMFPSIAKPPIGSSRYLSNKIYTMASLHIFILFNLIAKQTLLSIVFGVLHSTFYPLFSS